MKRTRMTILFVVLGFLLTGCGNQKNTSVLMTSHAEFAAYAEIFNASQDVYRIEPVYEKNPVRTMQTGTRYADLVIGEYLNSSAVLKSFTALDGLFKHDPTGRRGINPEFFYPKLLAAGKRGDDQYLLPVSFNLPAFMFKNEAGSKAPESFYLSLETIKQMSTDFNKRSKPGFTVMGFSPLWNTEVLYLKTLLFNTAYHELPDGSLAWNDDRLKDAIAYTRDWIATVNGGPLYEEDFKDKYLYDPGYKLILNDRIMFYYTDLRSFFSIPADKRELLDFRWIAREDQIPVAEDILFAGIPRQARSTKAAMAFLKWFFIPETQQKLLEYTQANMLRFFGIGDGFSSLAVVNETYFPRVYPALVGHIPPASFLKFPQSLPADWERIKAELLKPWLLKACSTENPGELNFAQELENYKK